MIKKEGITEEGLKNFLNAFSNSIDKKDEEEFVEEIEMIELEKRINFTPEENYYKYSYKLSKPESIYYRKHCVVEGKEYYLADIYLKYDTISKILSEIMVNTEGSACSVDRSRWLIYAYVKYLTTGELFSMEIDEKCYWKPSFGEVTDWVNLLEAIIGLQHGQYIEFIQNIGSIHSKAKEYQESLREKLTKEVIDEK